MGYNGQKVDFNSIEELNEARKSLGDKFESGIPSYLDEYFEDQLTRLKSNNHFREIALKKKEARKRVLTDEGRKDLEDYYDRKEQDFWSSYKGRLVKIGSSTPDPDYKSSTSCTDKVKEERKLTEEDIKALKVVCRDRLDAFAVRYFSHFLQKPRSKFHKFIYKYLNRKLKKPPKGRKRESFKTVIAAPRRSAKSSVLSNIFPIWCACYEKKKFIIIISDSTGQAIDFLTDIKNELESNELLKRDFPDVCGEGPVWRQDRIETRNGVRIIALGTGSKVRGRKFGIHRPDLVICDDIENDEMVMSKKKREFIRYNWFDKSVMFAGGDENEGETDFLVVGTILGYDSLLYALTQPDQYPDWENYVFKAVIDFSTSELWKDWERILKNKFNPDRKRDAKLFFETNKDEMLDGSKVLWPEGMPYYTLMVHKATNEASFYSEMQNDPLDPSKLIFLEDNMHKVSFLNKEISDILNSGRVNYYAAIDPSLGKNRTADYSCLVTIARDKKTGILFVVDIDIKKRSIDDQVYAVLYKYRKYYHTKIVCETNGFQIVLKDNMVKKSRELGIYAPIEEIQNYSDKHLRIQSIVPLFNDGTIVFDKHKLETSNSYALGVEQLLRYTESASHDDFPDALEMAVRSCRTPKFKFRVKSTGKRG